MSSPPRNLGRAYLVEQLRNRGVSRREAVGILNAIFAEMKKALKRGQPVEFPFGRLVKVRRSFGARWEREDDWPANRKLYTVEHQLEEEGARLFYGAERIPAAGPKATGKKRGKRRRSPAPKTGK